MTKILETRRLQLRPLREADPLAVALLANNWHISQNLLRVRFPYSLDDARSWLALLGQTGHVFAITLDDGLIGVIGLEEDHCGSAAELGYWLGEPWWGRGLMGEAVTAVLKHGFITGGYDRITAGYRHGNEASRRILLRAGFRHTGHTRRRSLGRKAMMDIATVEITRREWLREGAR